MPNMQQYKQFFDKNDSDHDGFLTYDDVAEMLQKQGHKATEDQIKHYFESADTNGDGKISFDEFMVKMGQPRTKSQSKELLRCIFSGYDNEGTGFVAKDNLPAILTELTKHFSEEEVKQIGTWMDYSGPGKVNYQEFVDGVI